MIQYFNYNDETGRNYYQVCREDQADGKKRIWQRHWEKDQWKDGLLNESFIPIPYRASNLLSPNIHTVYIVEGEKCADSLRLYLGTGEAVTTVSGGAGNWRLWGQEYFFKYLRDKRIILCCDNDDPGKKAGNDAVKSLYNAEFKGELYRVPFNRNSEGAKARIKYDVANWVEEQEAAQLSPNVIHERFLQYIEKYKEPCPRPYEYGQLYPDIQRVSEVEPSEIHWLWEDRIQAGALNVISGRPGLGKSFFTYYLMSHVSTGQPWDDGTPCPRGSILLFQNEEDEGGRIRPALEKNGAQIDKIGIVKGAFIGTETGDKTEVPLVMANERIMEQCIINAERDYGLPVRLVVIDPISDFWGDVDENSNRDTRACLLGISRIAKETGVAFILVTHNRKTVGPHAIHNIIGSQGIVSVSRTAYNIYEDKIDKNLRHLACSKGNNIQNKQGITFHIDDGMIIIDDTQFELGADELTEEENRTGKSKGRQNKRDKCRDGLSNFVKDGPKLVGNFELGTPEGTIAELAKNEGWSKRTCQRAKKELEMVAIQSPHQQGWLWRLPEKSLREECADF